MTIKGVLFDKDGTLIDFDKTWNQVSREMALHVAEGDEAEALRLLKLVGYDENEERFGSGSIWAAGNNYDLADAWFPELDKNGRRSKSRWFDEFVASVSPKASVPLTDLHAVLGRLRDLRLVLGIATNDVRASAVGFCEAAGLQAFFALIVGYDSVKNPKPRGDMVHAFCAHTQLSPSEVAVVGDNTHDLEMAADGGAGLKVAVMTGTGTREDLNPLADIVLEGIDDLPACLAEFNDTQTA
ncbi:MAG: HAD family hydrolase [Pseudomonadota bacterium]